MTQNEIAQLIANGGAVLGIEFGSTRIKAVLTDSENNPVASGAHEWENRYENGVWTYSLEDIDKGLKDCYADLKKDVQNKYGVKLTKLKALGFSAMMHGYMAFNDKDELLVPFRTWRNTITEQASEELTKVFNFHIPQRWSIAHLYQAILNDEPHVKDIKYVTTLAVYIHKLVTCNCVAGVGEASGMFPIDSATGQYYEDMAEKFNNLEKVKKFGFDIKKLFPAVLSAGEVAGHLTKEGALFIDPTGELEPGCPVAPPEGDAGTGMTATNAVAKRTGNVSAGTSVFAMVVMEKPLSKPYEEIDIVTTPDGASVAMVHCNNCTSDLNAWVGLFGEFAKCFGIEADAGKLYGTLYNKALEGDADCGGLLAYNYFSGEHVTGFNEGRPLFVRTPESNFNLANFMRVHLFTSLGALKTGLDILLKTEGVKVDTITGHGGLFKTKGVGQSILAAAINAPVTVMDTAGEGGAWGMAVLASYMVRKGAGETLGAYLADKVFKGQTGTTMAPKAEDVAGFDEFLKRYTKGLAIERAAVENI